jgi:hypothetical protein
MEPIPGLAELRPILDRLVAKNLIVYLTPAGRGATVTHTLYSDREMDKVRSEYAGSPGSGMDHPSSSAIDRRPPTDVEQRSVGGPAPSTPAGGAASDLDGLSVEVKSLGEEVATLRAELAQVRDEASASIDTLRSDLEDLNRSLGNL